MSDAPTVRMTSPRTQLLFGTGLRARRNRANGRIVRTAQGIAHGIRHIPARTASEFAQRPFDAIVAPEFVFAKHKIGYAKEDGVLV